ncbi:hypothetical protein E2320_004803, partial [Naja naja]
KQLTVHLRKHTALAEISEMAAQLHSSMLKMENFQKLHELKKDLIAMDNLVTPGRVFIPMIEESEEEWGVPHCFTLRSQHQSIVVAAR